MQMLIHRPKIVKKILDRARGRFIVPFNRNLADKTILHMYLEENNFEMVKFVFNFMMDQGMSCHSKARITT